MSEEVIKPEIKGARNLLLLTIIATVIAVATTTIGVYIYVSSGDIYLDRSLPGLLPDASEQEDDGREEQQYIFNDYGTVNKDVLDDFLRHFDVVEGEVREFAAPFSDAPLMDENLIFVDED